MGAEAHEKYRTLVELAPDAIFVADLETARITEANDQAAALLGRPKSEIVGMPIIDAHPTEKADQYRALFERSKDEASVRFDTLPDGSHIHIRDSDGNETPVEIHAKQIDFDGSPHVFSILRDVSEQVARSDRLERMTEELAVLNRLVRHDIRNDMAVVLGWIDQLEGCSDDAEGREIIDRIRNHGDHVVNLTELARDYVEVITGDAEPDLEPLELRTILDEEIEAARTSYEDADIALTERAHTDVDVLATPLLSSVFRNLLLNAVQHNDRETPVVRVDVSLGGDGANQDGGDDAEQDTVTVRVADNGPGIPDERKEPVFGKDERGFASNGTGMGLYLVENLVTQFGGSVHVEDRDPQAFPLPGDTENPDADPAGSVFVVELQRE
jgi:PAS domain S-box-containing protein